MQRITGKYISDEDGFKVCEVNSAPQFKGIEGCHDDLDVASEIFRYIRVRLGDFGYLHQGQPPSEARNHMRHAVEA